MLTNGTELTLDQLEEVIAGKGGINIPSQPIVNIISYIVCGGHNWVRTGREAEVPFMVFWSRHQKQYQCTKCGRKKWVNED